MNIISSFDSNSKTGSQKGCCSLTIQEGLSLPSSRYQYKTHGSQWVVPWAVDIDQTPIYLFLFMGPGFNPFVLEL